MSTIDEFLAGAAQAAPPVAPSPPVEEPTEQAPPESSEPSGVIEVALPSGIDVYFQEAPKRLYRGRLNPESSEEDDPEAHVWRELVSCSTVTKILDKPGLVHWGESNGIDGVQELLRRNYADAENLKAWSVDMVKDLLKRRGLSSYQRRDKAGKRGTSVHKALEGWAMGDGMLTDPEVFPAAEQGYVIGLNRFLSESGFIPDKSEVIVASLIHGIAGRFDLMGRIPEDVKLSTKLTRAGIEHRKIVEAGTFLVDLKTSSGVYDEYHLQVAGYQGICIESGYAMPERTAILRVSSDGKYEFVLGVAEWLDFWFAKGLHDSLVGIKERAK